MSKKIDCLIIGHNELSYLEKELLARRRGKDSPSYRDLRMSFINYEQDKYTTDELFNKFFFKENPDYDFDPVEMSNTFSTNVAYLTTYLTRRGLKIDHIKSFRTESAELERKLQECDIKCIAITTTFYSSDLPIVQIIKFIKKYNKNAKIIIGGPFIFGTVETVERKRLLDIFKSWSIDFAIYSNEGENALFEIIDAVVNDLPYERINNIFYWDGENFQFTEVVTEDNSLDENTVDWTLFEDSLKQSYHLNIRTSKSCPFSCSFCRFPYFAGEYRMASLESVEKELNSIQRVGKVSRINFTDDTFNVPPKRFKDMLRMMIKNKYDFKWYSFFRCQYADRETVELMKESGCQGVFLGIESGSQKVLDNMNKKVKVEDYYNGLALLNEYDIMSVASFIIGYPGETVDTFHETIEFIEKSKPTFYRGSTWFCDTLSSSYKNGAQYELKGEHDEWSHTTMDSVTAGNLLEQFYFSCKNSIWMPSSSLDYTLIFHMMQRGLTPEQIKKFFTCYNLGLKEKIENPNYNQASAYIIDGLKNACKI